MCHKNTTQGAITHTNEHEHKHERGGAKTKPKYQNTPFNIKKYY